MLLCTHGAKSGWHGRTSLASCFNITASVEAVCLTSSSCTQVAVGDNILATPEGPTMHTDITHACAHVYTKKKVQDPSVPDNDVSVVFTTWAKHWGQ